MASQHPTFRWNISNALTIARFVVVPIFMLLALMGQAWATWAALVVFVLAALSDALDGYFARKLSQITTFGKFADPLADKLLVTAAWLVFVELGTLSAGVVMVLVGREFLVTGLRILAISRGKVIAAGALGKFKTGTHLALVVVLLFGQVWTWGTLMGWIQSLMVWLSVMVSLASGGHYFVISRDIFSDDGRPTP